MVLLQDLVALIHQVLQKKTKSLQVLAGFIRNPIQHLVLVVADMVATVGESTYYTLETDITIENTGDVTAYIDNSLFSAYWDDEKLTPYNSDIKPVQLLPGEQTTVELKYHIDRNKYNSWYSKGHNITILIQYGGDSLAYVYSTTTDEVTVVQ